MSLIKNGSTVNQFRTPEPTSSNANYILHCTNSTGQMHRLESVKRNVFVSPDLKKHVVAEDFSDFSSDDSIADPNFVEENERRTSSERES